MSDYSRMSRARGCMLGQLAGDALGSLVEFQRAEDIWRAYPDGVREMVDGGAWNTIAGQPTDDSEMALLLARLLVEHREYSADAAREAYLYWLETDPFDCGMTISGSLRGHANPDSQANGAMMRISPLGIFGALYDVSQVGEWARRDCAITHPNQLCQQANALFAMAISAVIKEGWAPAKLYSQIVDWAREMVVEPALLKAVEAAAERPPVDFVTHQGWVLIAFQNALWQLLHCSDLEEGVVDTVMRGGDTDTNAAISGALLGAVHGIDAIPHEWRQTVLQCRPEAGRTGVKRPRPERLWPVDALELVDSLVRA